MYVGKEKSMKNYIKTGESLLNENIEGRFYQSFLNAPIVTVNESVIMEMWETRRIDDKDLEILEFLYQVSVCTKTQLEKFAKLKGISNLEKKLIKLSENLIINYFIFSDDRKFKGIFPSDAERYYCLHVGGAVLLNHLVEHRPIIFECGNVLSGSGKVIRQVATTEISLLLLSAKGTDVEITPSPFFTISTPGVLPRMVKSLASYWLNFEGSDENRVIILDAFFKTEKNFVKYDSLTNYSQLLVTQLWKKYYGSLKNSPLLFIIVQSEDVALECASQFNIISKGKFNNFMFVTTDSLIEIKDTPPYFSCLKYEPETKSLVPFNHYLFS